MSRDGKTGTLEEVLERVYDVYMNRHVEDWTVKRFLMRLKHEDSTQVFNEEDADNLLKSLRRHKKEHE